MQKAKNFIYHDFESLPFFQKVMISKLEAAKQHMAIINRYNITKNDNNTYPLLEMSEIYEDTLDFLGQLYALCDAWKLERSGVYVFDNVRKLENHGKELEHLAHAMLYKIETIHKSMLAEKEIKPVQNK